MGKTRPKKTNGTKNQKKITPEYQVDKGEVYRQNFPAQAGILCKENQKTD